MAGMAVQFVMDVHLARLARDLRMLGFDSLWKSDFADDELMKAALDDGRVLLTRDRALWERMPENLRHYVEALEPDQQLLEVLRRYDLVERVRSGAGFLSRCLQCNHVILPAKPHHVAHLVPGDILTRFDEFFFCSRCERVYWKGSHWERMLERVRSLISPA